MNTSTCPRCGNQFTPQPTGIKLMPMTRHCDDCRFRNLLDGLDLPTPPEYLDHHTKHPTLSEWEFREKLATCE
jgi:hypothetical protein